VQERGRGEKGGEGRGMKRKEEGKEERGGERRVPPCAFLNIP